MPRNRVWCVSGSRSMRITGSSSCNRCNAFASLSSSALALAWIATASTGSGSANSAAPASTPLAASTSPVARSFELGDGRDVAGRDLAHGVLFLAAHREELVDPFVGVRADVHEHVVVLHRALQHLEQVHVADVRVHDRLEHLEDRRAFRRGRRRTFLDEERHQTVDADELGRASAQNGEHRRRSRRRRPARRASSSVAIFSSFR